MKKSIIIQIFSVLLILLFVYTSTSKFLDYDKFVFQMRLAPVPLMKILAPPLGWSVPTIEIIIAMALASGFFYPAIQMKGIYASVILLSIFEIYIAIMLLSGSHLPCTCGGIISQMGWKQHLFFNVFFIIGGILSIKHLKKNKLSESVEPVNDDYQALSRA